MPSEREILQQNLREQALLKQYISAFIESIKNELREGRPKKDKEEVYRRHIEEAHRNFIKHLEKIFGGLKLNKYLDLQEIQKEIDKVAGRYLLSLGDARSKVKGTENQGFVEYLNKMNQAVGEALVNIEKSSKSELSFRSKATFIGFLKSFYQHISGISTGFRNKHMMFSEKAKAVKKSFKDQIKEKLTKEKEALVADARRRRWAGEDDLSFLLTQTKKIERLNHESILDSKKLAELESAIDKIRKNPTIILFNIDNDPEGAIKWHFPPRLRNAKEDEMKARFLVMIRDFLDPEKIEEYLKNPGIEMVRGGIRSSYNEQLSKKNEQTNNTLVRAILQSLELPKEEERIKRLTNIFSSNYYKNNSHRLGKGVSNDDIHLLSQTILKLNESVHDPKVKKKMTGKEFLNTLKRTGIAEDLLWQIYEGVYKNKIVMKINPSNVEPQAPHQGSRPKSRI